MTFALCLITFFVKGEENILMNDFDMFLHISGNNNSLIGVTAASFSPNQISAVVLKNGKRLGVVRPGKGKGPGESMLDWPEIRYDWLQKHVAVFDNRLMKVMIWDLSGNYMDEFNLDFAAESFQIIPNGYIFKSASVTGQDFIITDTKLNILRKIGHNNMTPGSAGLKSKDFVWGVINNYVFKVAAHEFALYIFDLNTGQEQRIPLKSFLKAAGFDTVFYKDFRYNGIKMQNPWVQQTATTSVDGKIIIQLRSEKGRTPYLAYDPAKIKIHYDLENLFEYYNTTYTASFNEKYGMLTLKPFSLD